MTTIVPSAQPSDFPSDADLEDAEDIIYGHRPRQLTVWICDCGDAYPCWEVRFAELVMTTPRR